MGMGWDGMAGEGVGRAYYFQIRIFIQLLVVFSYQI
jgi:hypothetical protein